MISSCFRYAAKRTGIVVLSAFTAFGMLVAALLVGPQAELRFAPPIASWEIIKAHRDGDDLSWSVSVDKLRSCPPAITWLARWGKETRVLFNVLLDGHPQEPGRMIATAGDDIIIGPYTAPVPRGWEVAEAIEIDATVKYDCGSPWPLPPLDVRGAVAR